MANLDEKVSAVSLAESPTESIDQTVATDVYQPLSPAYIARRKILYEQVVAEFPTSYGKSVSKSDRGNMEEPPSTLIYGEIDFESFGVAFEKVRRLYGVPGAGTTPANGLGILQKPGGKFYDLGSGTGKPCVAAAFLHPFDLVAGVELLPGLHQASEALTKEFESKGRSLLASEAVACAASASSSNAWGKEGAVLPETAMAFTLGDATDLVGGLDWSDGDLVFANSTCFDDALMNSVAVAAQSLRKGAIFITFTRRLPSANFGLLEYKIYKMSWGGATVFIHQKLTDPGEDVEIGPSLAYPDKAFFGID